MKIRILLAVLIVTIGIMGGAAYSDYQAHRVTVKKNQETIQQASAAVKDAQNTVDGMVTKYNALYEQCEVGVTNYSLMTTVEKSKGKMPNCGLPILQ